MLPRTRLLALGTLLLATTAPVAALGLDRTAAAARAFEAGSQAYAHGEFHAAALSFDEAYGLAPRGAAAYDGGLAWEAAGNAARAANDYARALRTSDLGGAERADATGRLKALEAKLGRLTISAPDEAHLSLDGVDVSDAATGVHVAPGVHVVKARFDDGRQESRTVTVAAREAVEVRFVDRAESAEPPAPVSPASPEATPSGAPSAESAPQPAARDAAARTETPPAADHTLALVSMGAGVVSAALAVYFYERGVSARDEFVNGGDTDASLRDQAESFRTLTWVSWGLAAAFAATGVVLYLTAPRPHAPQASLVVGPAAATLRFGF